MTKLNNRNWAAQWADKEKIIYEANAVFTQNFAITLATFESILYNSFMRILEQLESKGSQSERLALLYTERAKQVMVRDNDQGEDYFISNAHIHFLDDLIDREEIGN